MRNESHSLTQSTEALTDSQQIARDAFVWDAFVWDAFVWDAFVWDAFVWDAFVCDAFVWDAFVWGLELRAPRAVRLLSGW